MAMIKPYGDTLNDGAVQMSFTLPVTYSAKAVEAAKQLVLKFGFEEPQVVFSKDIGEGFSFFIVYGKTNASVNMDSIKVKMADVNVLDREQVNNFIVENFRRKIKVIGACIESDAHTVGIDAIMNMKGYNGHKGLESYKEIDAINLGAQVSCEEFVAAAVKEKADVMLVSQVVTQKDIHITNLTKLIEILEAEGIRDDFLIIIGGPRINHQLAQELGYDAGFGPGTYAEHVASYIVQQLKKRQREVI